MINKDSFFILFIMLFLLSCSNSFAEKSNKNWEITLRTGQGGFEDSRSDIDKLGGGQIAMDIQLLKFPIALSITGEYYTNSPEPTHSYEISDLTAVNLLYTKKPFKTERITIFAGSGFGTLQVPKDNSPEDSENSWLLNVEVGVRIRAIWKVGFYGIYKYLYAQKKKNNIKVIDFNEHIVMIGIYLSFKI